MSVGSVLRLGASDESPIHASGFATDFPSLAGAASLLAKLDCELSVPAVRNNLTDWLAHIAKGCDRFLGGSRVAATLSEVRRLRLEFPPEAPPGYRTILVTLDASYPSSFPAIDDGELSERSPGSLQGAATGADIAAKLAAKQADRNARVEQLREQQRQQETAELASGPAISQTSRVLAERRRAAMGEEAGPASIADRHKAAEARRDEKVKRLRAELEAKEAAELRSTPRINPASVRMVKRAHGGAGAGGEGGASEAASNGGHQPAGSGAAARSEAWERRRQEKLRAKREQLRRREAAAVTSKPEIDRRSAKLAVQARARQQGEVQRLSGRSRSAGRRDDAPARTGPRSGSAHRGRAPGASGSDAVGSRLYGMAKVYDAKRQEAERRLEAQLTFQPRTNRTSALLAARRQARKEAEERGAHPRDPPGAQGPLPAPDPRSSGRARPGATTPGRARARAAAGPEGTSAGEPAPAATLAEAIARARRGTVAHPPAHPPAEPHPKRSVMPGLTSVPTPARSRPQDPPGTHAAPAWRHTGVSTRTASATSSAVPSPALGAVGPLEASPPPPPRTAPSPAAARIVPRSVPRSGRPTSPRSVPGELPPQRPPQTRIPFPPGSFVRAAPHGRAAEPAAPSPARATAPAVPGPRAGAASGRKPSAYASRPPSMLGGVAGESVAGSPRRPPPSRPGARRQEPAPPSPALSEDDWMAAAGQGFLAELAARRTGKSGV